MSTRFMYKHELVEIHQTEKTINEMGRKGWRLHSITFSNNAIRSAYGDYSNGNQLIFEKTEEYWYVVRKKK